MMTSNIVISSRENNIISEKQYTSLHTTSVDVTYIVVISKHVIIDLPHLFALVISKGFPGDTSGKKPAC